MVKLKYLKMSKIRIILLILFFHFLINSFIIYAQENPLLMIILDCSRSMSGDISGKNKFETAKKIIEDVLSQVKDFDFGLITFGKNETNNPNDIELTVVPIPNNRGKILAELSKIKPKGLSPIGEALFFAEKVLKKGLRSYILLISDGVDNCDGKPLIPVKNLIQNKEVLKSILLDLILHNQTLFYSKILQKLEMALITISIITKNSFNLLLQQFQHQAKKNLNKFQKKQ